ncbi:hypothetical protein Aros01_01023 [Streptosporangium roseum]|uniref:Uncharacterized protein n=1 Tax=Streptosporangium roseum (strain ATCC 12428 / DSM 43021 / JCM 3005 / KCTC 9067 / NCIMB 10171 / NRRL 2505 / NI 9100) TaxID=479432 RepID=D2B601_STRRD|nr:hypothetical protein Sros_8821 [Streptosporangium roseum DSM 43021]
MSQDALTLLEGILRRDPDHAAARYALVVCLTDLGRAAEAVPHLRRVLDAVPEHYEAAYRLGRILQAAADPAGAAAAYRRVLEIAEYSDARTRLRQCEQSPSGATPDGSANPANAFPSGEEVPPPLRARVDDRRAIDRGRLIAGLRLQARYLAPAMLGKALLATVAAIPLVIAYAGGVSGPLLVLLASVFFAVPKVAAALILFAGAAGIVTGFLGSPLRVFDNGRIDLNWPAADSLILAAGTTALLIILILGIPAVLLNSRINGSDVYEYGVEVRRGLIRRTVQFIWYYQIVESPSYLRTLGTYFTHTASLGIRYNDNGASSVTYIEMSGVGTPARVKGIGHYLESRIPAERLPIRGPWT